MKKEIVILAKSSKHDEYCIAGIDVNSGEWVRPISTNIGNEGSVPKEDITYENDEELEILDKVQIDLVSHNPSESQPENYLYNDEHYWKKTGEYTIDDVLELRGYDDVDFVFYNNGKEVSKSEIQGQPSLLLLKVNNPTIFVKTFEAKKIQLNFEYKGIKYRYFKVSDPHIKRKYLREDDGEYYLGKSRDVVFSLTDEYAVTGKHYKMVAKIF